MKEMFTLRTKIGKKNGIRNGRINNNKRTAGVWKIPSFKSNRKIEDDRKKHKNSVFRFVPLKLLFSSSGIKKQNKSNIYCQ